MTHHDHRKVIAIDGPAAAGKSTVAHDLANQLGILLFDTGALYRAVTLSALRKNVDLADETALAVIATEANIDLKPASVHDGRQADVYLDDEDVSWDIRTPDVDANVSQVAAWPAVRDALLSVQRRIADDTQVVMVGRDIGTIVTPDAGIKIYLDASVEERARRRLQDLRNQGVETNHASVMDDLLARDNQDSTRTTAPLRIADDAIRIVTDGLSVEDIVLQIDRLVHERWDQSA